MNFNVKVGLPMIWWFLAFNVYAVDCMKAKWKRGKPYDYYAAETREPTGTFNGGLLHLVESRHFTKDVRLLIKGNSGAQPQDLIFTLDSIPNHPGALDSYSRYEFYYNTLDSFRQVNMNLKPLYDSECLLKRAVAVFPGYAETYLVLGMHYSRYKQVDLAIEKYLIALAIDEKNPEVHYNLGLAFLNQNDIESAKKHAKLAYRLGYPLSGLKNKIAAIDNKKGR